MNTIMIPTDDEGWDKAMYGWKCTCGHELYKHAFTLGKYNDSAEIRTSQCIFCDYDHESERFECEGFTRQ